MTWKPYIKLFIGLVLLVGMAWVGLPQILRAWTWFTYHHYPATTLSVPEGFEPLPRHTSSCRNHVTFVAMFLGRHVFRHGSLPYDPQLDGEDAFCQIDFDGMGERCHHGAPNQAHGGWQMVNVPEAVWDKIMQAMPGEEIPIVWCGRVNRGEYGERRIVASLNRHSAYNSMRELREATADLEGNFAFMGSGMMETNLVASLKKINTVLEAEGLKPVPIDVDGRPSYWNLAAPFQNVPQIQPKASLQDSPKSD